MATAIVGAVIAKNSTLLASSPFSSEGFVNLNTISNSPSVTSEGEQNPFDAIVTRSDVELTFSNDETFPWYVDGNTAISGNKGISNSTSSFSLTYSSSYSTQVSFNWWNNDRDYHTLYLFVDGVQVATNTSSSNTSRRFFVTEGTHVIEFRDIITEGYRNWDQTSCVKNISISQVSPLESVVLSEKSQNLTFENDSVWPWLTDDGFIQSSNYNNKNTVSKFSTSFSIDKPSKFSFWSSTYYYDGNNNAQSYSGYQYFDFKINGERYMGREYGSGTTSILLEPGEYTRVWCDSIYENSNNLRSRVSNIELSSNWVEVDIASNSGTLGVEVLYLVNVLNDVELLKVSGTLNSTDWATIKQMKNILALVKYRYTKFCNKYRSVCFCKYTCSHREFQRRFKS